MKLLFITSRFPWPLTKGDKLRAWNQIKYLSQDNEIILFSITQEKMSDEWIEALRPFCKKIKVYYLAPWKVPFNLFRNFFTTLPFQSMYYYNRRALREIKKVVDSEKPDRIMFQLIRTAPFARHFESNKCVIDLMDCLSYHYLLRSNNASYVKRLFYRWEYRKIKNYEQALLIKYNNVVIISEKDKGLLSGNNQSVQVISNGVYPQQKQEKKLISDLLFVGNMTYEPNLVAAKFLMNDVFPLVNLKLPAVTLTIAGIDARKKIGDRTNDNVTILENVADIGTVLASSKIFVAPMYLSTGIQNKVLEAMAFGLPVITTPNAAAAIGAINGTHLLTAVSASEFSRQIIRLLNLSTLTTYLTQNARALVEEQFDWERNTKKLKDIFANKKPAPKAAIIQ